MERDILRCISIGMADIISHLSEFLVVLLIYNIDINVHNQEIENEVIEKGYLPHIRHRGEQSVIRIRDGDHDHAKRR